MDRRKLLKAGAAGVALSAIGGGIWFKQRRDREQRRSEIITGPWMELGPNSGQTRKGGPRARSHSWLLPELQGATMVVPDRPHRIDEAMQAGHRAGMKRTRSFTVSTSQQRLRDGYAGPKPKGQLRVLAVGDSVTFGWGVKREQSWPAQLQVRLQAQGLDTRVLNCGVPANPLHTMAAFITTVGKRHQPDLVLFCRRPQGPQAHEYGRAWQAAKRAGVPMLPCLPPISRFDLMGMRMYRQEGALIEQITGIKPVELTDDIRSAQGQRGFGVRSAGQQVELYNLESGEVLANDTAPQRDLPANFYEIIDANKDITEPLMFDSGHPDAAGFEVVADTLTQAILERGLLKA
ncbi:MAG: lysophospholipase L1-like esterase [Cognaticolwellia sp.]|jgi:lysophospholipase L1-like esterase